MSYNLCEAFPSKSSNFYKVTLWLHLYEVPKVVKVTGEGRMGSCSSMGIEFILQDGRFLEICCTAMWTHLTLLSWKKSKKKVTFKVKILKEISFVNSNYYLIAWIFIYFVSCRIHETCRCREQWEQKHHVKCSRILSKEGLTHSCLPLPSTSGITCSLGHGNQVLSFAPDPGTTRCHLNSCYY